MKFHATLFVSFLIAHGRPALAADGCLTQGPCNEADVEMAEESVDEVMLLQMQPGAALQQQLHHASSEYRAVADAEPTNDTTRPEMIQKENAFIDAPRGEVDGDAEVTPKYVNISLTDSGEDDSVADTSLIDIVSQEDTPHTWGWSPPGCSGLLCMGNCPITSNPTNDGGCCSTGTVGTGAKSCVTINSRNLLKYSCGVSGTPSCEDDASFFSNKDEKEVCSADGQSCTYIKYGWWTRHLNIFGGDRQDKLECTCGDIPVFRRAQDGPWVQGR